MRATITEEIVCNSLEVMRLFYFYENIYSGTKMYSANLVRLKQNYKYHCTSLAIAKYHFFNLYFKPYIYCFIKPNKLLCKKSTYVYAYYCSQSLK